MESACDGGEVAGDDICVEGHTGKLCSVCEDNYAAVGIGPMKSCVECEGSKTAMLKIFGCVVTIAILAFLCVVVKEFLRDAEKSKEAERLSEKNAAAAKGLVGKIKKAQGAIAKMGPFFKVLISYVDD